MAQILDGKKVSAEIRESIKAFIQKEKISPHLVVFLTHPHPASTTYVSNKLKACADVGIRTTLIEQPISSESEFLSLLAQYSQDKDVDGILTQLPLHPTIDPKSILKKIPPEKDVDGLHPENLGKLVQTDPSGFIPCTALGIATLLDAYKIPVRGKHVVIVGRSITVGKPLALLLAQKGNDATVTLAHTATENLEKLCASADIIVAAAGHQNLITPAMVNKTTVIIDVGINRVDGKIIGDVDQAVYTLCKAFSPVPGGVGPMTIASLLQNTLKSYLSFH